MIRKILSVAALTAVATTALLWGGDSITGGNSASGDANKLQGKEISLVTPLANYELVWNDTIKQWVPSAVSGGTFSGLDFTASNLTSIATRKYKDLQNAPTLFNVKDYGAAGDGVTDDTAAIQAAIDAVAAATGGTIYFPNGVYIVGGALQSVSTANAQIVLPSVQAPQSQQYTVRLLGETPASQIPWFIASPAGNTPSSGVVIKSTLASGTGALIGAYGPDGGYQNFTNITFVAENIDFRTVANPTISALNLYACNSAVLKNVVVDAGNWIGNTVVQPTTSTSYGVKLPQVNNGGNVYLDQLQILGFNTGLFVTEHTVAGQVEIYECNVAAEFFGTPQLYPHSSQFHRLLFANCVIGLKWTSGHATTIDVLDIEHAQSGWYSTTADIEDPSNLGAGYIGFLVVNPAVGFGNDLMVNGAAGISRHGLVSGDYTIAGNGSIATGLSILAHGAQAGVIDFTKAFNPNSLDFGTDAAFYSDGNYTVLNSKTGANPLYLNFDNTNASSTVNLFAGNAVFTQPGNLTLAGLTASQFVETDANKKLVSFAPGTGVRTALGVNVGSAGAFVVNGGALGTPSSGNASNLTSFPTLNQNTTGSAASLSISGQTGLLTVTGLASTNRIKTVRDAADTILELGGSYTPTGTWTSLTLVTPALGTPASGVVTNLTGTASININGTVGATTPAAGTFTSLAATLASTLTLAPAANTAATGWLLTDTTAASSGNQQYSPALRFTGQGWKTTATAASQAVDFRMYVVPVQGAANPTGQLWIESSINGAAFGNPIKFDSAGDLTVGAMKMHDYGSGQVGIGSQAYIRSGDLQSVNSAGGLSAGSSLGSPDVFWLRAAANTWCLKIGGGTPNNSSPAIGADAVNGFTLQSGAGTATWNDSSTANSGTVANRYLFGIAAPTLTSTGTSVTNTVASTVYIGGAPTDSTNTTSTTKWALNVAAGNTTLGGTLAVTGATTLTGGVVGTTTAGNATAGNVGEYVESLVAVGSPQSLSTGTAANVTSISLTAGDWDVGGLVNFTETTSTVTARSAGISTTTATLPTDGSEGYCGVQSTVTSETNSITLQRKRVNVSSTTTIYLVAKATFSAGTCGGFGTINARRVR